MSIVGLCGCVWIYVDTLSTKLHNYWNMAGYTKLFSDMLDSTVWQLSKEARLLFITMLLKKDRNQIVKAPLPGLAHIARLTLEETKSAMEELTKPDEWSQSKEHEGRRILKVESGWLVVNGAKYRDRLSVEERREYKRVWQQEYREKQKQLKSVPTAGELLHKKQCENGEIDINSGLPSPSPTSDL